MKKSLILTVLSVAGMVGIIATQPVMACEHCKFDKKFAHHPPKPPLHLCVRPVPPPKFRECHHCRVEHKKKHHRPKDNLFTLRLSL